MVVLAETPLGDLMQPQIEGLWVIKAGDQRVKRILG